MPLARMTLSMSQRCASNRRTCGSPRLSRIGGNPWVGRFMGVLRGYGEFSHAQWIAAIIGAPRGALSTRLVGGRRKLRNRPPINLAARSAWQLIADIKGIRHLEALGALHE